MELRQIDKYSIYKLTLARGGGPTLIELVFPCIETAVDAELLMSFFIAYAALNEIYVVIPPVRNFPEKNSEEYKKLMTLLSMCTPNWYE